MAGIADLDGKVAVVTGGASGIGLGIARRLAAAGAQLVIGDVEVAALHRAADDLGALAVQTDVRDRSSVQALADAAVQRFGTVNVVVNNAGVGPFGRIADLTEADWRWIIDVNLWGVVHGTGVFLPILQDAPGGGHFVNTASMAGLRPGPNLGAYTVTKYGVVALTETLAIELAEDESQVGVTVLLPGPVHTNIGTSTRNRPAGPGGRARRRGSADGRAPHVDAARRGRRHRRRGDPQQRPLRRHAPRDVPAGPDALRAHHRGVRARIGDGAQ